MKKIIISLFLFFSLSPASMLLSSKNLCIEDFYLQNGSLFVLASHNNVWYEETTLDHVSKIITGFKYDETTQKCTPEPYLILGMDAKDFAFIMGFIGVLIGFVFLFFTTELFIIVGGKK
jgi:hypothetical protein